MRELRFWDFSYRVMTYSRNYKNMSDYFYYRQKVIKASHGISDMLSVEITDKNGKMVFEGDVVKFPPYYFCDTLEKEHIEEIEWDNTGFNENLNTGHADCPDWCKIIGNKFSNPKLTEGK